MARRPPKRNAWGQRNKAKLQAFQSTLVWEGVCPVPKRFCLGIVRETMRFSYPDIWVWERIFHHSQTKSLARSLALFAFPDVWVRERKVRRSQTKRSGNSARSSLFCIPRPKSLGMHNHSFPDQNVWECYSQTKMSGNLWSRSCYIVPRPFCLGTGKSESHSAVGLRLDLALQAGSRGFGNKLILVRGVW